LNWGEGVKRRERKLQRERARREGTNIPVRSNRRGGEAPRKKEDEVSSNGSKRKLSVLHLCASKPGDTSTDVKKN